MSSTGVERRYANKMITVGILLVVIVVIFIVYLGRAKRQPKPYVDALIKLAGDTWRFSDEVPADWRKRVSTYLKGWTANFDPQALTELGDLLAEAGQRSESKETFRVLLLFPTYSKTYFAGLHDHDQELVDSIVSDAKESIQKLD